MLKARIIVCVAICLLCEFRNTLADEQVLIELHTGKKLRAQRIERDSDSSDRVLLSSGREGLRLSRVITWSRIRRLSAPAEMLVDLPVPSSVQVVDARDLAAPRPGPSDQIPPQSGHPGPDFSAGPQLQPDSVPVPNLIPLPGPYSAEMPSLRETAVAIESAPFLRGHSDVVTVPWSDCPQSLGPAPVAVCSCVPWCWRRDPGVVIGVRDPFPVPLVSAGVNAAPATLPDPVELFVSARAFNRNGLADWNSLEVSVQGRTADGLACRVRGSLRCTLFVRRAWLVRPYAETFFGDQRELAVLGQWSKFVEGNETDANGVQKVVFALPPQSPDHNLGWDSIGMLTAELDIPGQGRLSTSSNSIALRQLNSIRGRSVVDNGSSLLPGESVSEGISPAGNWPAPLSSIRPESRRFTVQP